MKELVESILIILAALLVFVVVVLLIAGVWCLLGLGIAWVWNLIMPGYGFQETLWWHWSLGGFTLNAMYSFIKGKSS